jgi:hypothetical protein
MPPIQPKLLAAHPSRAHQPSSGCVALFGLPFVLLGLFFLGAGLDWFQIPGDDRLKENSGIAITFGSVLVAAGLLLVQQTITGKRREARRNRRLRNDPERPWLADHPWDETGETYRVGVHSLQAMAALLFLTAFLAPFNYLFFPFPAVLIFDVLLVAGWGWFVYTVVQGGKYGDSRLRFAAFPFYLGSQAVLYFEGIDRLKGLRQLKLTFRCVEESVHRTGKGSSQNAANVCYSIFEEEQILAEKDIPFGEGSPARFFTFMRRDDAFTSLRLEFPLPEEEKYETQLSGGPVRYWELEAVADTPGVDYAATFLVPVYRRRPNPKANAFPG